MIMPSHVCGVFTGETQSHSRLCLGSATDGPNVYLASASPHPHRLFRGKALERENTRFVVSPPMQHQAELPRTASANHRGHLHQKIWGALPYIYIYMTKTAYVYIYIYARRAATRVPLMGALRAL